MTGGVDQYPPPIWGWLFDCTSGAKLERGELGCVKVIDRQFQM
jgi:hypothetical protein